MARINQGITGGFSGNVGGMISGNWNGISYMRRKPTSISGTGDAQPTDKAIVVAINPAKEEAAYTTEGAPRSAETEEVKIPPSWSGDEVHTYLAFTSEDGNEIATSTYCGTVIVQ